MAVITAGSTIIVTAASALFDASQVGRELWKTYLSDGSGGGRARIIEVVDSTHAKCLVLSQFDNANPIAAANWRFTTNRLTGLNYLEGETVSIIGDGGTHRDMVVNQGAVTLDFQVSTAFVGYKYRGILTSLNLDSGGQTGSAQGKPRLVWQAIINMVNTVGFWFGTSLYSMEKVLFRQMLTPMDRPPPPLSGNKKVIFGDSTNLLNKQVSVVQNEPLPCTITSIDSHMVTTDDQ